MHTSVFIIDDEVELTEYTAKYFNMSGVKTEYAFDAKSALEYLEENTVSLILLDINLGGDSGFDLCQKLRRETDVPILFISARSSEDDMMLALNIGGDDYVCKPYSLGVLLAKVKAVLKRYEASKAAKQADEGKAEGQGLKGSGVEATDGQDHHGKEAGGTYLGDKNTMRASETTAQDIVRFGDVTVDLRSGMVKGKNGEERLKAMEYKILSYLLQNKNRIISKDEFFEKIWETEFVGDVTLNVHIRHLREKLEENPKEPKFIKTVWGVGFILEDEN